MSRSIWALLAAAGTACVYVGVLRAVRVHAARGYTAALLRRLLPPAPDPVTRLLEYLRGTPAAERIARQLGRSGLTWDPALAFLALIGAGAAMGGVLHLFLHLSYWTGLPLGLWATVLLFRWYLVRARKAVLTKLISQLPDVARSLAHSTRAGASVAQALEACAGEFPDPAGGILRDCTRRISLGQPLAEALTEATARLESTDLRLLVMTVTIQHRLGGNLPGALLALAQTQDERIQAAHEVQSLLASTRSSALILPWTPWVVALGCNLVLPGFLRPLLTGWGIALIVAVALLQGLGILLVTASTPGEV